MTAEEMLERDREFVRKFEAAVEADLAAGRAATRRYFVRYTLLVTGAFMVLAALRRVYSVPIESAIVGAIVGLASSSAAKSGLDGVRQEAAQKLQRGSDPRLAGVVAQYAVHKNSIIRNAALCGLYVSLQRLDDTCAKLLGDEGVTRLCRLLLETRDTTVIVPLIEAIERLHDTHVLPTIRRVAESPGFYLGVWLGPEKRADVNRAAAKCLRTLDSLAEKERHRSSLLRPAEAAPADGLLRPSASPESTTASLLRSSKRDMDLENQTAGLGDS